MLKNGQNSVYSQVFIRRVSIIKEYTGKFQKMLKEYDLIKEYAGKCEENVKYQKVFFKIH